MSNTYTEVTLLDLVRRKFDSNGYAVMPQVSNGTGSQATRYADALVMSLWPSRGLDLIGIEIKVTRNDWRREMKDPGKAEPIAKYCDWWYVVAPKDVVPVEELPAPWGLLEAHNGRLATRKVAERLESVPITKSFLAAILRAAAKEAATDAELEMARRAAFEEGKDSAEYQLKAVERQLTELQGRVREFWLASGVNVSDPWESGKAIGEAVAMVLNGTHNKARDVLDARVNQLVKLRDQIDRDIERFRQESG